MCSGLHLHLTVRNSRFQVQEKGLFCPCTENKGTDHVQLYFHIYKTLFLMMQHIFSSQLLYLLHDMSHVMRKPVFCLCENKDADQLRSNCEADQRLCFRYLDSTIYLLPKFGRKPQRPVFSRRGCYVCLQSCRSHVFMYNSSLCTGSSC